MLDKLNFTLPMATTVMLQRNRKPPIRVLLEAARAGAVSLLFLLALARITFGKIITDLHATLI